MEDVIFNGSEGRRPLGMAEVSLHFKNLLSNGNAVGPGTARGQPTVSRRTGTARPRWWSSHGTPVPGDHEVPIAATSEIDPPGAGASPGAGAEPDVLRITAIEEIPEQVVVTRRIYRSGESEYILNGERCRLKDIQDLLCENDIGSRLYSTIEQGRSTRSCRQTQGSARHVRGGGRHPRVPHETAAAEQKLEAAQANLLRINDIGRAKFGHADRRQAPAGGQPPTSAKCGR